MPEVEPFRFYIDAFNELGTSRPVGMGVSAISFTAIVEYFRIYPTDSFEEFHYIIRRMDNFLLALEDARSKKEKAAVKLKGDHGKQHSGQTNNSRRKG